MGLKGRLQKAEERAESFQSEVILPGGESIVVGPMERWNAVLAVLNNPENPEEWPELVHRIMDAASEASEIDALADPTSEDFCKVLLALGGPRSARGPEPRPEGKGA
jgi:hypothetical protein